ncbi:uncharacterized protein [Apostichopus japonicus]|uniref:uncharacterized protein isoform X1 n=1 Tax=Stichopus japonicus TaxID=307972 RepID=UPI003AB4DB65
MSVGSVDTNGTVPGEEEVRTLFVSGLPMDAKPRELYLLFRGCKGYEGSLLKVTSKPGKSQSPVGFVTFDSRAGAEAAKESLQGVRFDSESPQTIRLEFAKSNTKVPKPKQTSPLPGNPAIGPPMTPRDPYDLGTVFLPGTPETWGHPETGTVGFHPGLYQKLTAAYTDPTSQSIPHHQIIAAHHPIHAQVPGAADGTRLAYVLPHPTTHHAIAQPGTPHSHIPQPSLPISMAASAAATMVAMANTTPCTTLFLGNLGSQTSESELHEELSRLPGFLRLRVNNKGGSACCFAEFHNVAAAMHAFAVLQGRELKSSDRGGLRVEFAKSNMGEPKRMDMTPRMQVIQPMQVLQ